MAYTGQMECSVETWVKRHNRHIHLYQPEKSAAAEYRISLGQYPVQKSKCMDCIIAEVTEIELHPNNMNR
jgi:hypothetical protein